MSQISAELSFVTQVASRTPALQREHELELTRRFRDSGDPRAADVLVRAHLRLVIAIAVKYRHYGIPVSELVAEGNCGLMTALHRFDPERGLRLGTYARHWVRAHVLACAIRSLNLLGERAGHLPPRLFFRLRRERARIAAVFGEGAAAHDALAERMNVTAEGLQQLLGALDCRGVSLDAPRAHDSAESVADALISADDPEERYFRSRRHDVATSAITVALAHLDSRERFLAEHRLMAGAAEAPSLADIARTWGVSRERVRQLEERAKQKLSRSLALQGRAFSDDWLD